MTAPSYRWLRNPRYQKAVQKLSRLRPDQKAIFDTVAADEAFADEEMRNRLQMMDMLSRRTAHERHIGLSEDVLDFAKDEAELAEQLGWANIGVSGLRGFADMRERKKLASLYKKRTGLYDKYLKRLRS